MIPFVLDIDIDVSRHELKSKKEKTKQNIYHDVNPFWGNLRHEKEIYI